MSNGNPLVSVVIPTYNYARYLDEAIKSVLSQSYETLELIVLDDGSTDETRRVLQKYTDLLYWETHQNMGQAATLNKGWSMSKGQILAYLSPDDVFLPDVVATSVRYLQANPDVVMTYCDYYLIDASSKFLRRVNAPEFDYWEMVTRYVCPPGPGAFIRRGPAEAAGAWNKSFRLSPDYDYWLRLGLQGDFLRIPEALAGFRVHDLSQSFATADERKSDEYIEVISGFYKSQRVPPEVLAAKDEALSNAHIVSARSHLRSGRYAKGLSRLREGVSLYPRNLFSARTFKLVGHGLLNHRRYKNVS